MRPLMAATLSVPLAVLVQIVPIAASAQPEGDAKRAFLILQQGDVLQDADRRFVEALSGPVNAGGDHVGIAASLSSGGDSFMMVGHHDSRRDTLIFAPDVGAHQFYINRFGVLAESAWGVSDSSAAPFAIKAAMPDSSRALLSNWGVLQQLGSSAPALPAGTQVADIQRIQMLLNGQTYWVADWLSPTESGRALYRAQPGPKSAVDLLMNKGDAVCGGLVANLRHFRMAENQIHGQVMDIATGSGTTRTALYVDGHCPFVLGEPLPSGQESPTEFWHFDVNSSGHVLFGAITDQPSYRNAVTVLDGRVVMREGDVIDGIRLAPPNAEPNEVRLDDRGRAVTLWAGTASSTYTIFYTPDIQDFEDTRMLVSENTPLDLDGDGQVDATLQEFRFFSYSGPTFSLAETGIYIAVWLRYPGLADEVAAVIFYPF